MSNSPLEGERAIAASSDVTHEVRSPNATAPVKPSRRRDKIQMSCTCCRARKVKCDRTHPCQNCTRRGESHLCSYLNGSGHGRTGGQNAAYSEAASMRQRVTQLEGLLRSFIQPPSHDLSSQSDHKSSLSEDALSSGNLSRIMGSPSRMVNSPRILSSSDVSSYSDLIDSNALQDVKEVGNTNTSFGRISLENAETSYVGSSHWAAVLEEVVELKDSLGTANSPEDFAGGGPLSTSNEPDLLFSPNRTISQAEILGSIPPKDVVDRLVSRYFSSMDMAPVICHTPTFQKEYAQFWLSPYDTSLMWLGVLFCMMCLAEHFCMLAGDEPPGPPHKPEIMMKRYRQKVAQCLILGNYTRSSEYTLECLILYHATEQFRSADTRFGVSIVLGIIVRTAMRMGYHRDSSHYPNISVFHAEMRRRVWSTIVIADVLNSTQVGLPRLINEAQVDSQPPRNLLDEDFSEESAVLPPARPNTECTLMLYAILKYRLTSVFGLISDQATMTVPISYTDDVMRLDKQLHEIYGCIPPGLSLRSMASSITDSSALIVRRFALELLFQKARCVLHRRYLVPARNDRRYIYSRRSCIDGAMHILSHQSVLHKECRSGGLLHRERWKVTPLFSYDFLLAAMIICVEFDHQTVRQTTIDDMRSPAPSEDICSRESMLQALRTSFDIWNESAASSTEALRASAVVKIILEKVTPSDDFMMMGRNSDVSMSSEVEMNAYSHDGKRASGSKNANANATANISNSSLHNHNPPPPSAAGPSSGSWPPLLAEFSSSHVGSSPFPPSLLTPMNNFGFPSTDYLTGSTSQSANQQLQSDSGQVVPTDMFTLANAELIESMIYEPSNLDWGVWDSFL